MNTRLQTLKYVFFDYIAALLAWFLFFRYRKVYLESTKFGIDIPFEFDQTFFLGLILIPISWVLLYAASGFYKSVYRKSRLIELGQTINPPGCLH